MNNKIRLVLILVFSSILTQVFSQDSFFEINNDKDSDTLTISIYTENSSRANLLEQIFIFKQNSEFKVFIKSNAAISVIYSISSLLIWIEGSEEVEYFKFSIIVFDNKITDVQFNGNTISAKTSFEDLKRIFPDECKETRPIHIYGDVNQYQACDVGVADDQGNMWDMKILFFFLNNQLKRIEFWVPT